MELSPHQCKSLMHFLVFVSPGRLRGASFLGLGPTTMAVSLTPKQWKYVYDNTTERSTNGSLGFVAPGEFYLSYWMDILSLLIVLLGLVGNSLILWLLSFRIPGPPFSVYILNLAVANVLFLCSFFFLLILKSAGYYTHVDIYDVLINATFFFYCVGLSLLAAISTERCLAMLFPSWYLHRRPKYTSTVVCLVLWALPGLFWGLDFVLCHYVSSRVLCRKFPGVPVVCSQRRQPPRLYLLVLLMVLVFLLCGLPRGIQDGILGFPLDFMPPWLTAFLACLNSSSHPFIYFLLGCLKRTRGKDPLRVVLQRALVDKQKLEGGRRDIGHTKAWETSF
uniref:Mas-related G-protein coupled receptor member X4-like n=1 Tax=Phascolarctos cinereus TaxID=38626 RepID=A0A6P5IWG5_PHACI|nr:mas-related G-protein coupled receptor member X4-like [Phascolarctos cinereus]